MISRRQLRIKALTVLYACNRKEIDDLETAEQELMLSIGRAMISIIISFCLLLHSQMQHGKR